MRGLTPMATSQRDWLSVQVTSFFIMNLSFLMSWVRNASSEPFMVDRLVSMMLRIGKVVKYWKNIDVSGNSSFT